MTGASNVTGYMPEIHRIARLCHAHGARILVDAAQLLGHAPIDVRPEDDPEHNVAGAVGLAAALSFLMCVGMKAVRQHERALTEQTLVQLGDIDGVALYGPRDAACRTGVVSFNVDGVCHELVARLLDREAGVAVRNGCFCAQPYVHHLLRVDDGGAVRRAMEAGRIEGLPGAVRASIGIENAAEDVEALVRAVRRIRARVRVRPAVA